MCGRPLPPSWVLLCPLIASAYMYIILLQPDSLIKRCQRPTPRKAANVCWQARACSEPNRSDRMVAVFQQYVRAKAPRLGREQFVVRSYVRWNWAAMHTGGGGRAPIGGGGARGAAACFFGSSRLEVRRGELCPCLLDFFACWRGGLIKSSPHCGVLLEARLWL